MNLRGVFRRRVAPALIGLLLHAAAATAAAPAGALFTDVPLPGGLAGLLRAAGIPGQPDPAIAMLAFVRVAHASELGPQSPPLAYIDAVARRESAGPALPDGDVRTDLVPVPLTPAFWSDAVFGRNVPPGDLAAAILGDRRAAFVYHGLMALDDRTLAFFSEHPALVRSIAETGAGPFAEWGRSIHVSQGSVEVPGGKNAEPLWQAVIGEPPASAPAFIRALVERDGGRAAFFFDTIAHLDPSRQAFALGPAGAERRAERFRALYGVFARTKTFDPAAGWPVLRHPFNPAAVLREAAADASGRMAGPGWRGLWEAAFGGGRACARAGADASPVDAAWLVDRIEREPLEARGPWLGAVAFAQRVFGRATRDQAPAVCQAAAAFPRANGLLLTLERIGLDDPNEYAAAISFADRAWAGGDRWAAVLRTAQVQGVLAVLDRAVSSRAISKADARRLLASLFATDRGAQAGAGPAAGSVARWICDTMLAGLCPRQPSGDRCLVGLASGEGRSAGEISWEDDRYRIDLGAAAAVRMDRVLEAQRATRVDDALNMMAAQAILADPRAAAADLGRAATILGALGRLQILERTELFGHAVPPMRTAVAVAAAAAGRETDRSAAAGSLVGVADALMADALVSLSYAMAIGDPDDAVLMGGNLAHRHLFDGTLGPATPPWHTPDEVRTLDGTWVVEGSTLMLRLVYARTWLRRLSIQDPGKRPRPDPQDVLVFGETEALFNPFDLTDASRDAIVAALGRGRAAIARLVRDPDALWAAAADVGLGEWRCRAALLAAGRGSAASARGAADFFSLLELMRLGRPDAPRGAIDAWGAATRPIDGGPWVRMPAARTWEDLQGPRGVGLLATQVADVHLRVAEELSALKLPASLAPDVSAYAAWDAMTEAMMAHPDDWFAAARGAVAIPADRFLDYVAALTAIGPLVPVR